MNIYHTIHFETEDDLNLLLLFIFHLPPCFIFKALPLGILNFILCKILSSVWHCCLILLNIENYFTLKYEQKWNSIYVFNTIPPSGLLLLELHCRYHAIAVIHKNCLPLFKNLFTILFKKLWILLFIHQICKM